jgi:hypothetical protein
MKPMRCLLAMLVWAQVAWAGAAWSAETDPGAAWSQLTPAEQQALAPLAKDWSHIEAPRRAKWLEVASRFPTMPAAERARVQARMAEWARMTPAERGRARLQFQEAKQVSPTERQAKWQAYQALSEDERRALNQRARPAPKPAVAASAPPAATADPGNAGKKNVVQVTATPRAKAVTPTSQQARPGATTTPMTTRAAPPAHHQTGMPKIAATPGFVDPATLLPKRGPQGAAVRSAAASSEPAAQP